MTTITSSSSIAPRKIRVIGVPLDLGQSRRGVDMGPSAVRVAGLEARLEALGHVVEDAGNISVAIAEQKKEGDPHAKYLKEIMATCTKHAELIVKTLEAGKVPITLGGDHSIAAGTVAGVAEFLSTPESENRPDLDRRSHRRQHPDSSPSGNVHGMPLAAIMGLGPPELCNIFDFCPKVRPENCVLVGVRDIDAVEKRKRSPRRHPRLHHARHRRAQHAHGDGRSSAHRRTRHRRLSRFARHGLGRSRRRARRRYPRFAEEQPIARLTWPWKLSPITVAC